MSKFSKPVFIMPLIIICGLLFVLGCSYLFSLRFAQGDVFPEYSSKRKDPMGTSILAESLNAGGYDLRRHFLPLNKIENAEETVVIMSGVSYDSLLRRSEEIDHFLMKGGRLVACMYPVKSFDEIEDDEEKEEDADASQESDSNDEAPREDSDDTASEKKLDFLEKLGLQVVHLTRSDADSSNATALLFAERNTFLGKETLPFYSRQGFSVDKKWNVLYEYNQQITVTERAVYEGELLISNDVYCISNEGISKHRNSPFLLQLIGDRSIVYFDETVHGINETRTVLWLAKRYKLHILGVNLFLVVVLLVWKNLTSVSNLALEQSVENEAVLSQRTNHSGMINLLKYTIPPKQLVDTCFTEWSKSTEHARSSKDRINNVTTILKNADITKQHSVLVYNDIVRELNQKNKNI